MTRRYRFFSLRFPSQLAWWLRTGGTVRSGGDKGSMGESTNEKRPPQVMRLPGASELAGRIAARRAKPPAKLPSVNGCPKSAETFRLSNAARHLSRSAKARQGHSASASSARAALLEGWVTAQNAAAEMALEGAQEIPGIRLEPEFVQALASLRTRRVEVYGEKPQLFEDTERLAWAIQTYVAALRQPHDGRQRLMRAAARVSQAESPADPAPDEEALRARRELAKAKRAVSRFALTEGERRLNQARELMVSAREGIERDFHITRLGPIEADPFGPFPAESGGQRQSDSNRRELRPRSAIRP